MSNISISNEPFTGPFSKVDKRHLTVYHTLEIIDDDYFLTSDRPKHSLDVPMLFASLVIPLRFY